MNLQELTRWGFGVAKATIARGEQVIPVFLAIMKDGEVGIIMAPWESDDAKVATFGAIRKLFAHHEVQAYAFVSECWMVRASESDPWDGTAPSKHAKRIDVLMIDAHSRDGEGYSMSVEIDHNSDGTRAITKEPENLSVGHSTGRAVNFLVPEESEVVH